MDKTNMKDRELLSLFLFGEITDENLIGGQNEDIEDLIDWVDEDTYDFCWNEEPVGIDLAYLGDSDNHTSEFSAIQNDVRISYERFGNSISGMELQWADIEYLGSNDERKKEIVNKLNDLGIEVKNFNQVNGLISKFEEIIELVNKLD